jgi:hypothetical protein
MFCDSLQKNCNNKERKFDIKGAGYDLIKFDKVMCSHCNTTKTPPFDRSYNRFIISVEKKSLMSNKYSIKSTCVEN